MQIKEDVGQYETTFTVTIGYKHSDLMRKGMYDVLREIRMQKDFINSINKLLEIGWIDDIDLWTEQLECYGRYSPVQNKCDECPVEKFCWSAY